MKVAFDGAPLGEAWVTGVARAFLDGLSAYAAAAAARGVQVVLLLPEGARDPGLPDVEVAPAPRGALRRQLALPRLLRRLGADLLHSPVAAVPLRARCPTIATVHDLPWLSPGSGERTRWSRAFATRCALRAARAVIAPSQFTAQAAARLLPGRAQRVRCIPHGTDRLAAPPTPAGTAARTGPLLVLGDDRPRKNRERVRAAHGLARRRADLPDLRFVGPPADYVGEPEKQRLLGECRALVQCSTFEGFGLPVLEGLAHGCPVLCADIPPFRALADGVALFAPPRDVDAIAAAMVLIHRDEALRARLAAGGWERAGAFGCARTAEQWWQLHREITA